MVAEAGEASLDDGGGVLGHVEHHRAGVLDGEAAETGGAAGDRDGQVEGKPGLAALGRAAEDPDGGASPERGDEPLLGVEDVGEIGRARGGQGLAVHRHADAGGHVAPVSSSAAWRVGSSRKVCPRAWAMRSAARRSLEATRSTPRQARKSISRRGRSRIFCVAPAALKAWSTAAAKVSRSSGLEAELGGDAGGEGGVLVHVEAAGERGEADEPEGQQVAAVEGEVEEAGEVEEEGVGEVLRLVDDDDGGGVALVDHVDEGLLDVGPELAAAMGGLDAELAGEGAVEIEGRDGGVAEVEDEVVGPGQGHAQVADRRGLADAGLGGEDAEAGLVDELLEGALASGT